MTIREEFRAYLNEARELNESKNEVINYYKKLFKKYHIYGENTSYDYDDRYNVLQVKIEFFDSKSMWAAANIIKKEILTQDENEMSGISYPKDYDAKNATMVFYVSKWTMSYQDEAKDFKTGKIY